MANINYSFERELETPGEEIDSTELNVIDKGIDFTCSVSGQVGEETVSTKSEKVDNAEVATFDEETEQVGKCTRARRLIYRRRGLLFAIVSALFYSAEDVLMDVLAEDLDVFQIPSMGSSIVSLIAGVVLIVRRIDRPRGIYQWMSLAISGLLVAVGYPTALLSLKYMDVGASVAIIYTMPLFTAIFGWLILKEALKIIHVLFLLFSFGGVILISQPVIIFGAGDHETDESENLLLGTLYGLLSAISFALVIVVARKQTIMGINMFVIMFSNALTTAAFNALVCTIIQGWSQPSRANWFEIFGYVSVHFFAHMALLLALMLEAAVLVSIATTSEVVFAFMFQIIIFRDYPDWLTITGAILIVASCVGIALNSPKQGQDTGAVDDVEIETSAECKDNVAMPEDKSRARDTLHQPGSREVKNVANGTVVNESDIDVACSDSNDLTDTEKVEKTGPNDNGANECGIDKNVSTSSDNITEVTYHAQEVKT